MKNKISQLQDKIQFFKEDKKQQKLVLIGVLGIIFFSMMGIAKLRQPEAKEKKSFYSSAVQITDFSKSDQAESEWMAKSEDSIINLSKQMKTIIKSLEQKDKKIKELEETILDYSSKPQSHAISKPDLNNQNSDNNNANENLSIPIYDYSSNLNKRDWSKDFTGSSQSTNSGKQEYDSKESLKNSMGIESFDLTYATDNKIDYELDNYLPAGSYATARLLSSVDASVGVESQANPRPVLFRVTSNAQTAKNAGESQTIDIKGCTVTGAASGDLSSEKVYIRLLKMTCSKQKNKVIETQINGYAAALGKAGIRGPVVSREGDYLVKSFFAGMVSSFGDGMAARFKPTTSFVDGITSTKQNSEDIAKTGLGEGTSNAMDRLANYLIKRAEQYQPVVAIPANIDVELVFIEGVSLDGTTPNSEENNQDSKKVSFNEVNNE